MSKKTKSTKGFIVACMNCHGGRLTSADTKKEAQKQADIHLLGGGDKPRDGHVVAIIPAELIKRA